MTGCCRCARQMLETSPECHEELPPTSRLCSFMNRYNSPASVGIRLAYQSPSGLVPAGASAIGLNPRASAALPVHRIVIIDSLFRSRTEATASVLRKRDSNALSTQRATRQTTVRSFRRRDGMNRTATRARQTAAPRRLQPFVWSLSPEAPEIV